MFSARRIFQTSGKYFEGVKRFSSSTVEPLTICTDNTNGVRRIVMNSAKNRNALSVAMMKQLLADIKNDVTNKNLRLIVISSNGPVFCAGHDLKELVATEDRAEHARIFSLCSELMETIQDVPVPVVTMVDSLATAAGCQLVATSDLAVASDRATFCTPGVNIGLFCSTPAVALARSVPRKLAFDMLFTGRIIDAQTALSNGLVSRVVKPEELESEVDKIADKIISNSRSVYAVGKASVYRQIIKDRNSAYMDASNVMVQNMSMQDGREGITSFLNKKKPNWSHSFDE